jgi:hypothetical protein
MATRFQDWLRQHPGAHISGSETGKWLVVWCSFGGVHGPVARAQRFDSYLAAQIACTDDCGVACHGVRNHSIVELAVEAAFRPSKSFRRMVEAD